MIEGPDLSPQRRAGVRLVVVGASAGGVEALQRLVAQFDHDLRTAVAIVLHVPPGAKSLLPQILARRSDVPTAHAVDQEPLESGRVYVAPPDLHLSVDAGHRVNLTRGPRENNHRPAIDVLFRSAAETYGPRAAAVVLSGTLDDGAAGLAAVARGGGVTMVQRFDDALFTAMPRAARAATAVDLVGSADEIGRFILSLGSGPLSEPRASDPPGRHDRTFRRATASAEPVSVVAPAQGSVHTPIPESMEVPSEDPALPPSRFTCPDCHGSLWLLKETGGPRRYRCRVGHAWSEGALVERQGVELENALWMAMRLMDERLELFHRMRGDASMREPASHTDRWLTERIDALQEHAAVLRQVLAEVPPGDSVADG